MAEIAPKTDDSERAVASLLPSIEEKQETPFDVAHMEEELKEQISALGLYDDEEEHFTIKPPTLLNRTPMNEVMPPNRFGPVSLRTAGSVLGFNMGYRTAGTGVFTYGFGGYRTGIGGYRTGIGPVYQCPPIQPAQVERFEEPKDAKQQNPALVQNLTFPVQVNRFSIFKESGVGTGVFFPNIPLDAAEEQNTWKRESEPKKTKNKSTSPYMGLPEEWTY